MPTTVLGPTLREDRETTTTKNTTVVWQTSWRQNSSNNTTNTNKNNNYTYDINLQMWDNGDSPDSSTLRSSNVMVCLNNLTSIKQTQSVN